MRIVCKVCGMPMRATTVRFSDDLWGLIEAEAARQGISTAQYIREAALLRLGAGADAEESLPAPGRNGDEVAAAVREAGRVAAVRATGLLDSTQEPAFDRVTRLASRFLNAPVSLVSLVDEDRQFFKSCLGLPEPWQSRRGTGLTHSFCQYVVAAREPLIVTDAREHPELRRNMAIRDLAVIAYVGVPLLDRSGFVLGTLCAIDDKPRLWSSEEVRTLQELAEVVVAEIERARPATSPAER